MDFSFQGIERRIKPYFTGDLAMAGLPRGARRHYDAR
jgi:hypothetical protein